MMSNIARSWLPALATSLVVVTVTTPALGDRARPPAGPPAADGQTLGFHRFQAVSATSPDRAFAVGYYGVYTRGRIKNGRRWSITPSPDPSSPQGDFLTGVSAVSSDD